MSEEPKSVQNAVVKKSAKMSQQKSTSRHRRRYDIALFTVFVLKWSHGWYNASRENVLFDNAIILVLHIYNSSSVFLVMYKDLIHWLGFNFIKSVALLDWSLMLVQSLPDYSQGSIREFCFLAYMLQFLHLKKAPNDRNLNNISCWSVEPRLWLGVNCN